MAKSKSDIGSGTDDVEKVALRSWYLVSPLKSKLVKCKETGPLNVPEKLNNGVSVKQLLGHATPEN